MICSSTLSKSNINVKNPQNNDSQPIKSLLAQVADIRGETVVIKLPAEIINDDKKLINFAQNIYLLSIHEVNIIIVHDYSQVVDTTLQLLGVQEEKVKYKNTTDYHITQIIEMVLVGQVNKKIVSSLCNVGCVAVGISGKDANLIEAKKSKVAYLNEVRESESIIDLQFVSEPAAVNPEILTSFEDANLVTVISPVSSGPNNSTCLLDVDVTAAIIASSMTAKYLIFLTEFKDNDVQYKNYTLTQFKKLYKNNQETSISQPIIQATINSLENNVEKVKIINSTVLDALITGFF